jgi:hypothetical protein
MRRKTRKVETMDEVVKGIMAEGGTRRSRRLCASTGEYRTDVALDGSPRNYNPDFPDWHILY